MCATVVVLFVTGWGRLTEMAICAVVCLMVFIWFGKWREMVMCAAIFVIFRYIVGETEGNCDMCCCLR